MSQKSLLLLLQLCNSSFPLGAYSYSDAIESLVEKKVIFDSASLYQWLENELIYGSIKMEAGVFVRVYHGFINSDQDKINYWNNWLIASRETSELREQTLQMGKSLRRLIVSLEKENDSQDFLNLIPQRCSYTIAFSGIVSYWQIPLEDALLGYLHSWLNNLIGVGIKLIPLGQTEGQKILLQFNDLLKEISPNIIKLKDEELNCCSWGLSMASMHHETLYSRLFRS